MSEVVDIIMHGVANWISELVYNAASVLGIAVILFSIFAVIWLVHKIVDLARRAFARCRSKNPKAAKVGWLASVVVAATGVALLVGLSPHRSDQDDGRVIEDATSETLLRQATEVVEDDLEAVLRYRKAAEQGDARAQFNLGLKYANGEGVPKDDREAVLWYRKAAEQGHAGAQLNIGFMYDDGKGVAEDDREAVLWYRKAAEQGNANAQFNLGLMYMLGEGVAEDDREALLWYRRAAEQGHASAQFNLGLMYMLGEGVPKDDGEAALLFHEAAKQGDVRAQSNLGIMYANGVGVSNDDVLAYAWAHLAAAQGDVAAREFQADLSGYMTRGQIAEAQKLSRELVD